MPVEVLGFDSRPRGGRVRPRRRERPHRAVARRRAREPPQARAAGPPLAARRCSLETIFDQQRGALVSELNLVLKADVSGSLEAFEDEIAKLPQSEVQVQVVRSGVGGITESDVNLAAASEAVVLGFNVRPVGEAAQLADREGVEIRSYSVIYRAIDELRDAMQGMLAPEEVEETVGSAEVRAIFRASKVGTIAGSMVTDGKITRGAKIRLVRDGTVVHDGRDRVAAPRQRRRPRGRSPASSAASCSRTYADVKEGDVIEVVRDAPGRAQALLATLSDGPAFVVLMRVHLHLPGVRLAEGQAGRAQPRQGPSAPADGRLRGRGRRTWTPGSARRSPSPSPEASPARCDEAADRVQRMLDASFPQGVRTERRIVSWDDLGAIG